MDAGAPEMAAKPYRWGRLFIRFAASSAVGVLILTALALAVVVVRIERELSRTRYHVSPEVSEGIAVLVASRQRTADFLAARFGADATSPYPPAGFPEAIRNSRDLDQARHACAAYREDIARLQERLVAGFSHSIAWLNASMSRKAGRIRQAIQERHAREAAALESRIAGLRERLDPRKGIFEPLGAAEYQDRVAVIDEAVEFLTFLRTLSDSEPVLERVDTAIESLRRLKATLPEPASETFRLAIVRQVAELRRALADLLRADEKLQGEHLVERLETLDAEVRGAMHGSWAVEADLDRVVLLLDREGEALDAARHARRNALFGGLVQCGATLAAGLLGALFLLVVADVLRAFLDMAATASAAGDPAPVAHPAARTGRPTPSGTAAATRREAPPPTAGATLSVPGPAAFPDVPAPPRRRESPMEVMRGCRARTSGLRTPVPGTPDPTLSEPSAEPPAPDDLPEDAAAGADDCP